MFQVLAHGSIVLVLAWLIAGGLGAPLPEDLALLAAGVLAHRGAVSLGLALAVCLAGGWRQRRAERQREA